MEFKMTDMMNDPTLSALDRQWVVNFEAAVNDLLSKKGFTSELSLFTVSSTIGLDVSSLHKEGTLLYALWVVILNCLQKYITVSDYKYPTVESFLEAYPGQFQNETEYEKKYLWLSANWMCILFRMITARKNKGLVLQVVPKLIEGWDAKYVTGSGQTKATANRVHIFETEGNTKANQRGKVKSKKKPNNTENKSQNVSGEKPQKRKREPVPYEAIAAANPSAFAFTQPFGSVAQYRDRRHVAVPVPVAAPVPIPARAPLTRRRPTSEGSTDGEENGSLNEDVKSTFAAWQEATENYGLGLLNLSRSNSYAGNGLARNVEQQLTDPMDYQRGFSWTEIPVVPGTISAATSATGYGGPSALSSAASFNTAGLPTPMSPVGSLFPSADSETFPGTAPSGNKEVGEIVPTSDLMDMFKGYK